MSQLGYTNVYILLVWACFIVLAIARLVNASRPDRPFVRELKCLWRPFPDVFQVNRPLNRRERTWHTRCTIQTVWISHAWIVVLKVPDT
ncbi:hypothetical protein AMEX_G2611 [Astyanax mexicanus]|uniref:Uncharacterized protein n=1 Tax=Astyanax mexicanus TaxID=7994 RepID=A0A8T2MH93_ASTMX|nr:hypothetical protein AMEX_G2611 [Astyanax mexicanus]